MEIEKVWVIKSSTGRSHVICMDSRWSPKPSLNGNNWGYITSNGVIRCDWACPSTWVETLIPRDKGCMSTMIKFDDGRIVCL